MTKNKIKAIIIGVALVLVIALSIGLIVQLTKKDTPGDSVADDKQAVTLSGKVYDDNGDEMISTMIYSMPSVMTIAEVQNNTVSQVTLTATVLPENATDGTVTWSIEFDDGCDTDEYLSLEPTYYGSTTAVLTCYGAFDHVAVITVTSNYDETKKDECYVYYLYEFNSSNIWVDWSDIVFKQENHIDIEYDFDGYGSAEGDLEYGDLYIELDGSVIYEISQRLGKEFTPTYKILSTGYDSDGITFNCPSPYYCFAAGSGIDEQTFNEAFARAIYFGCGEDCDYHAMIHFTAKYSYKGDVIAVEDIWHDGVERITVNFSLEGLVIPVDDVIIDRDEIAFGAGTSNSLVCSFDGGSAISTDSRIKVSGNQSSCSATTVNAIGKTFSKYLKMESNTQVIFSTASTMTLTLYVDTVGKRIKVDGQNYTSTTNEDGDYVVTITLSAGSHTITKGDAMGLFALQLNAA